MGENSNTRAEKHALHSSAAVAAIALAGSHRIGLGCMALTGLYGRISTDQARATFHAALDHGITLFDTAPLYANGENEKLVGTVVGSLPGTKVITKFGLSTDISGRLVRDSAPTSIRTSVENSLRRLRLERIDLLLQHRRDPSIPDAEVAGCVQRLMDEGKVASFGLSKVSVQDVEAWSPPAMISAVENEFSAATGEKHDEIQSIYELGGVYIAYSPLGRGLLTRSTPNQKGDLRSEMKDFFSPDDSQSARLDSFRVDASKKNVSLARHALDWIFDRGSGIVAIPGCRSPDQVRGIFS